MSMSDDEDFEVERELYIIAQDCQVKRENLEEWERIGGKFTYANTIKGLPVRVLIDENNTKSYMVGIIQEVKECAESYTFGNNRKANKELILDITEGDGVGVKYHMVSNSGITEDEWDAWVDSKQVCYSETTFQQFIYNLPKTLEEGLKNLRYLTQNNYEKKSEYGSQTTFLLEHVIDQNSEPVKEFPESLKCNKCGGLPIKPFRCPNEHILCEGCFYKFLPKKDDDGQAVTLCRLCKEYFPFQQAVRLFRDELGKMGWSAQCPDCGKKWKLPMDRGTPEIPDRPYLFHMHLLNCSH